MDTENKAVHLYGDAVIPHVHFDGREPKGFLFSVEICRYTESV